MDALLQDLRFALRTLWRSPVFTAVAVLTLAIGIGANTTIFAFINTLLLRPPAHVRERERLVGVYTSDFSGPRYGTSSYADYIDFRQAGALSDLMAYTPRPLSLSVNGETSRVWGEEVTGNYFSVLGVVPGLGRAFLPDEDQTPGTQPVTVMSHGLHWALEPRTSGGRSCGKE